MLLCLPEAPTPDPKSSVSNVTLSPLQKEELAKIRRKQLANAVQYIWETGEDKYMLRYFHTGFWLSCEKHNEGLRSFRDFIPASPKPQLIHELLWSREQFKNATPHQKNNLPPPKKKKNPQS